MRSVRSVGLCLLLAIVGLTSVSAGGARADDDRDRGRGRWRGGQHNSWYGRHNYPYYWSGRYNNPYSAYNPYRNWYGTSGGYYGRYPYYNWARTYPWGWYY